MSIKTIEMQMSVDEVPLALSPPITLQRLTEVPPPPAYAPPPAPEAIVSGPPGLAPPPGLFSASGLEPMDVEEITPEMKLVLDDVSLELTRIANAFSTSEFMMKDEVFEIEYFTTMLPPGLFDEARMASAGNSEDESDLQINKLDGNESSDESTRAWSKSSNPDEASNLDGDASPTSSLVSDEDEDDESDDVVAELPDLSTKACRDRKLKATKTSATNSAKSSTRIVFGEQGAELAAQAAYMARANAGVMASSWEFSASSAYWHPYYGYVAW